MLHELLLALSGQPSPLFEPPAPEGGRSKDHFPLLSPPEKALLEPLAHLSRLHTSLRSHTTRISSTHPSTIARAVSTAIFVEHLGKFQAKILEVEQAILSKDASYVGGYGIVPLSTVVGEFAPWVRRLEWLWEIARFTLPEDGDEPVGKGACTGASLIDYLRKESHTGYLDLEAMALELVKVAETAWVRQLSMWLLYGQLPSFGRDDFFIRETTSSSYGNQKSAIDFTIDPDLLPNFVSPTTASSILFVGKSLNHIKSRGTSLRGDRSDISISRLTLNGSYLGQLSALSSPISSMSLTTAISEIRVSLSLTALAQLLPLPKILEILSLLHSFFLLGRGEFAMSLVSFADERGLGRHRRPDLAMSRKGKGNLLDGLSVKEGEVTAVLAKTWAELYSLQNEEDPVDDELELARELLRLTIKETPDQQGAKSTKRENQPSPTSIAEMADTFFDDLLFATPTTLALDVRPPLDLFLAQSDLLMYSRIHAYLLGIRRAQIHLNNLWRHSSLRRSHPSPWGPPLSSSPVGQERLRLVRERERSRSASMRAIWATASAALFVLSELTAYFQGEVINGSWLHFKEWLDVSRPISSGGSRPVTASSFSTRLRGLSHLERADLENEPQYSNQHDPEAVTSAHRAYLTSIIYSLFLPDADFTQTLRTLLTQVDHFIALITRLEHVQRNLDLETDEGVVDALANYAQDEKKLLLELRNSRAEIEREIMELVTCLRRIDDNRLVEGKRPFDLRNNNNNNNNNGNGNGNGGSSNGSNNGHGNTVPGDRQHHHHHHTEIYEPWKPAGVDRLLMKLDFGGLTQKHDSLGGYDFGDGVHD
ncbi:hypothetical protein AJ80_06997 [Polytolypa hystricis UAMH7299]|uniref:Spindle pole body component n=1 Tax=Polytolypa hystricis (strain UAMH7299) TaxID=1447883 RepID=A0A2B7XR84_POLH7|nr:hypothetical protein AJ80_06997 [Polytolypa hystricis UAMH7299]